ncbi:DMT family transporter [Acinetobacter sp. B51(2017)]|uniref:DMT family transporter n=1 Tax=Acinetobacter sp. B51(2017) TaxID=2060938 RepID=UPI000F07ABDB|nr:DMT family transporter [Acinetobacter sp. B51(2017)]
MNLSAQLLLLIPFVLAIGAAMTLQTAINTQVSQILASSLQAAFLSFSIGTVLLALLVLWARQPLPQLAQLFNLPWYSYCAGMLGVYAISISIYTAPKLGFLTFSGLVIFGQLLTSMLFDHFGWLGAEKNPIHWQRLLGGVVIFVGVLLTLQR